MLFSKTNNIPFKRGWGGLGTRPSNVPVIETSISSSGDL